MINNCDVNDNKWETKTRWWFQIFFIFTPKIGEDFPFDEHIFQMGWFNHQPENEQQTFLEGHFFFLMAGFSNLRAEPWMNGILEPDNTRQYTARWRPTKINQWST